MGQKVRIPTLGVIEFPDEFTQDDIKQKISDYRKRMDAEAAARGQVSDWAALERVNKKFNQKFYTLDEAQSYLEGEASKSQKKAKNLKRVDTALSVLQFGASAMDVSRHLEVGSQFAGAVSRDILEAVSGKDAPLGSLILEQRGWDNLNEYWESQRGIVPGPRARAFAAASGDKSLVQQYQEGLPQYPADQPSEEGGLNPFFQGVAQGIEESGPIAEGLLLQRAGLPMPLAYGSAMGADAYGKTGDPMEAAKGAALGAVVPSVGQAGRNMAGKMLSNLAEKAPALAGAKTAQRTIESTVSLGSIGVLMEGININAYRAATPEKRKEMLLRSMGSLVAFGPMEFRGVAGQPTRTQVMLGKKAPALELAYDIQKANKGLEALAASPEGMESIRRMADDYVFDAMNPEQIKVRGQKQASTPPEAAIIEAKTKKTIVPMEESEAVELKEQGIDPYKIEDVTKDPELAEAELLEHSGKQDITESSTPSAKSFPEKLESLPSGEMTMPRRIKAPDISGNEVVSIADIRKYLSESLDIPIRLRVGTEMSHKAGGTYYPKSETIRMKRINELPVIAHEVGHHLHYILFPGAKDAPMSPKASDFYKKFDHELMKLGAAGSGGSSMTKSKPEWYQRGEGVAEFFKFYMLDRADALAKAPDFTQYFERVLAHEHPEVWTIVNQARRDVTKYINQPAQAKVESIIDFGDRKQPSIGVRDYIETVKTAWVDQLRPIERAMENLKELPTDLDPYKLAINYTGGWRGKVEHSLEKGQLNYNGDTIGPSFRHIMENVESHKDFATYLVAKRTLELNARGKRTGVDIEDAKEVVSKLQPKYGESAEKFYKFHHNELKILEEAGIITAKERAKIIKDNQFYAPFHRAMESEGGVARHGKGFVDLSKGIKGFKGGDQTIVNPLETTIKNMYLFRDLAERNRVAKAFVDAVEGTRGGGRVADKVGFKRKQIEVNKEEVERYLKDMGLDKESVAEFSESAPEFKIWRSYNPTSTSDQIVGVWKNGKQQFYQIEDAELYRALKMQDSTHSGLLESFWFKGALTAPSRILRGGATLTPEFFARNPFRDQVAAAVYSKYGFVPFVDGFRGMLHALKKDDVYWDWVKSGGRYADFLAGDRKDITRKLSDYSNEPQVAEALKKWGNPLTTLQKFSELMEMSTRISEFRRAKQRGASDVEAANAAKDITLNFSRHGYYGKTYNSISAFYNAKVQDISKFAKEQKNNPIETNLKAMLYITTPSVLTWWLGKDDKEIQNLPEWRKNLFWNVNVRPLAEQAGVEMDDFVLSIPKPFMLGTLYGTSSEKALDYVYKDDKRAIAKFYEDLERSNPLPINPAAVVPKKAREAAGFYLTDDSVISWDNVPTGAKVMAELATNYDTFRRRSIESAGLQNLPQELRMGAQTSETAKALGSSLGVSPMKIDHAVRGIFAGLGKHGTDAIDYALIRSGLVDIPTPPKKMLREMPVLKAFSQSPYAANKQVQEFYRGAEKAEQTVAAIKQMGEHMLTKQQKDYFAENKNRLIYYTVPQSGGKNMIYYIAKGKEQLSLMNKAMTVVQKSKKLSAEEKQRQLIALSRKRNELAEKLVLLLYPADYKKIK